MRNKLMFALLALVVFLVCAAPVAAQQTINLAPGQSVLVKADGSQAPTPVIVAPPTIGSIRITIKTGNAGLRVYQSLVAAKCHPSWLSAALRVANLDADSQITAPISIDFPAVCGTQAPANADEVMAKLAAYQLRAERDRAGLRSRVGQLRDERDKVKATLAIRTTERDEARRERDAAKIEVGRLQKALDTANATIASLREHIAGLTADLASATTWRNVFVILFILALAALALLFWRVRHREAPAPETPDTRTLLGGPDQAGDAPIATAAPPASATDLSDPIEELRLEDEAAAAQAQPPAEPPAAPEAPAADGGPEPSR